MIQLNNKTLKTTITTNNAKFSLVKFGAIWCGPCKMLSKQLESTYNTDDNIPIYEVDIDSNIELCNELQITNVPVLIVYDNKMNIVKRVDGLPSTSALLSIFNTFKR